MFLWEMFVCICLLVYQISQRGMYSLSMSYHMQITNLSVYFVRRVPFNDNRLSGFTLIRNEIFTRLGDGAGERRGRHQRSMAEYS